MSATLEHPPLDLPERPPLRLVIRQTGLDTWGNFAAWHYLDEVKLHHASTGFTGYDVETGQPVAFVAVTGMAIGKGVRAARATRMVIHPEFQGAGLAMPFLNLIAARERAGLGYIGAPAPTYMHTSHPGFIAALRRAPDWTLVSQQFGGRVRSDTPNTRSRFGHHLRAVAGFRYDGPPYDGPPYEEPEA